MRKENPTSYTGPKASQKRVGQARFATDSQANAAARDDLIMSPSSAGLQSRFETVTIATDAVLLLATTPIELVAAPGADKYIEFFGATFILNYATTQYTEAADNLGIKYTDAAGVQVSEDIECTGFIDQAADTITNAVPKKDAIVAAAACVNQALVLDNLNANFGAGDSPLEVQIRYRIVTASL